MTISVRRQLLTARKIAYFIIRVERLFLRSVKTTFMRTLIITFFATLLSIQSRAQDTATDNTPPTQDTIKILKGTWGTTYHEGWRQLNMRQLSRIIESNNEAYNHLRKAKANNTIASVFAFAGGFAIGWSLADIAIKGEVSPGVLIAGGAAILVSIPFGITTSAETKKAVEQYNHDLLHPGTAYRKPQLQLGFNAGGVGLALRF